MRLTADLLGSGSTIPLRDAAGDICGSLWCHAATWACRDAPLEFRLIGPEPLVVPEPESSEPVVGALARLLQAIKGSGALLLLGNPAAALGAERILYADGVRLFSIVRPEDESCWDALLAYGQPVYGVRGIVSLEASTAHPAGVMSALAYGLFTCDEGLSLTGLHEDRAGVAYACDHATTATVLIRHGFEAAELHGAADQQVRWLDRGNEAVVRLVITDAEGHRCSTQPRFVVPQRGAEAKAETGAAKPTHE